MISDVLNLMHLLLFPVRESLKELTKQYDKSENDLKALQSVGQVSYRDFSDYVDLITLQGFSLYKIF